MSSCQSKTWCQVSSKTSPNPFQIQCRPWKLNCYSMNCGSKGTKALHGFAELRHASTISVARTIWTRGLEVICLNLWKPCGGKNINYQFSLLPKTTYTYENMRDYACIICLVLKSRLTGTNLHEISSRLLVKATMRWSAFQTIGRAAPMPPILAKRKRCPWDASTGSISARKKYKYILD